MRDARERLKDAMASAMSERNAALGLDAFLDRAARDDVLAELGGTLDNWDTDATYWRFPPGDDAR